MTGAHLHLALNHVPVVLVPVAVVMLAFAMSRKSADLTTGALVLLVVSALFGAGAFLTGEPAEDVVKQVAGVSTDAIEAHEEFAQIAVTATAPGSCHDAIRPGLGSNRDPRSPAASPGHRSHRPGRGPLVVCSGFAKLGSGLEI